jgi:hypothetical protein
MHSYIRRLVNKRKDQGARASNTKAANYKKMYETALQELIALRPQLIEWQAWADKYREATTHAYDEASTAQDQRREVEQVLHQILKVIEYGDRGAATAIRQIQELIGGYLESSRV